MDQRSNECVSVQMVRWNNRDREAEWNGTSVQATLNNKANTDSPNFTGVAGFDAISIGSSTQALGVVTPTITDPCKGNVTRGNGIHASGTITAPSVKNLTAFKHPPAQRPMEVK